MDMEDGNRDLREPDGGTELLDRGSFTSAPVAEARGASLSVQVIGAGTVGTATGRALLEWGHDVTFKDVSSSVRTTREEEGFDVTIPQIDLDVDLSIVAVPTPYDSDTGQLDMGNVSDAVQLLAGQQSGVVAIRSTVTPGTTDLLAAKHGIEHYAAVPEFLFADSPYQDVVDTDQMLVGAGTQWALQTVKRAFGTKTTFVETTPAEAEFAKLASNTFAATKISFANEIWRLAGEYDASRPGPSLDPDVVLTAFRQMTPWHGRDKGLEGGWPYGGHCLPKDLRGLRDWARTELDTTAPQVEGTITENETMTDLER